VGKTTKKIKKSIGFMSHWVVIGVLDFIGWFLCVIFGAAIGIAICLGAL